MNGHVNTGIGPATNAKGFESPSDKKHKKDSLSPMKSFHYCLIIIPFSFAVVSNAAAAKRV